MIGLFLLGLSVASVPSARGFWLFLPQTSLETGIHRFTHNQDNPDNLPANGPTLLSPDPGGSIHLWLRVSSDRSM